MRMVPPSDAEQLMCQGCADLAEYDTIVEQIVAAELPKMMAQQGETSVLAGSALSVAHSPSTTHPNTGKGVHITTDLDPAPRHGELAFFRTESGGDFG